jgi:hypothetical protein
VSWTDRTMGGCLGVYIYGGGNTYSFLHVCQFCVVSHCCPTRPTVVYRLGRHHFRSSIHPFAFLACTLPTRGGFRVAPDRFITLLPPCPMPVSCVCVSLAGRGQRASRHCCLAHRATRRSHASRIQQRFSFLPTRLYTMQPPPRVVAMLRLFFPWILFLLLLLLLLPWLLIKTTSGRKFKLGKVLPQIRCKRPNKHSLTHTRLSAQHCRPRRLYKGRRRRRRML